MILIKNLAFLAGVGAAAALGNPSKRDLGLSDACQTAILGVVGNQEASSCLNVPGLPAILTLQANFSIVPALNTWLQGVCRADPCSNDTINAISNNITTGCQADIARANIPQNTLQTIFQNVPTFYPTVRKIACLKSTSNDTLCATSTLIDIEQFIGQPLTAQSAMGTIPGVVTQRFPADVACTGCILAAFDTFKADQPALATQAVVERTVSEQCGLDFLNASQPSDVVDGTGSAAPTGRISANLSNQNGALRLTRVLVGTTMSSIISFIAALFLLMT